jgi:Flp pilus assembly pilin Flp
MLDYIKAFLYSKGIFSSKKGQGLVEYAILLILIAAVAFVAANALSGKINVLYTGITFKTK